MSRQCIVYCFSVSAGLQAQALTEAKKTGSHSQRPIFDIHANCADVIAPLGSRSRRTQHQVLCCCHAAAAASQMLMAVSSPSLPLHEQCQGWQTFASGDVHQHHDSIRTLPCCTAITKLLLKCVCSSCYRLHSSKVLRLRAGTSKGIRSASQPPETAKVPASSLISGSKASASLARCSFQLPPAEGLHTSKHHKL